jgi:hypothetical protein
MNINEDGMDEPFRLLHGLISRLISTVRLLLQNLPIPCSQK